MTLENLIPTPRHINLMGGNYTLENNKVIVLDTPNPHTQLVSTGNILQEIKKHTSFSWEVTASKSVPNDKVGVEIQVSSFQVGRGEGYLLYVKPERIVIIGNDDAGIFYGLCTLVQLIRNSATEEPLRIPCAEIHDWPDFPARGVMLDISRDKVPTLETLFRLVDMLSSIKINQLQLYTEHTFAYQNHPAVWQDASPITGRDALALDRYCRERFIELVPNQNSFGHMHRWFEHESYAPLGELYEITLDNWWGQGSFSLNPVHPDSFRLIQSLYDELLPNFTSRQVNIGCDETFDLGKGRSKKEVQEKGKGRVYLDFLLRLYNDLSRRNRIVQFWGDIILEHPELVPELPRDIIALEWGYEADHPFGERSEKFASSGIPFYVCPGTSTWNSIAGRSDNAVKNLQGAASAGHQFGAIGYLITDWGDNGHWQTLPISYLGYAAGAAYSWCYQKNKEVNLSNVLDKHLFQDPANALGTAAYKLGNVYQSLGVYVPNASPLFHILQRSVSDLSKTNYNLTGDVLNQAEIAIEEGLQYLRLAKPQTNDQALVIREFYLGARMLSHAVHRGQFAINPTSKNRAQLLKDLDEITSDYHDIWHSRNRPGGYTDSVKRFDIPRRDYLNNG